MGENPAYLVFDGGTKHFHIQVGTIQVWTVQMVKKI